MWNAFEIRRKGKALPFLWKIHKKCISNVDVLYSTLLHVDVWVTLAVEPIRESEQIIPNEFPVRNEDTGALFHDKKNFPLIFVLVFDVVSNNSKMIISFVFYFYSIQWTETLCQCLSNWMYESLHQKQYKSNTFTNDLSLVRISMWIT